jgi:hypothetical protein
MSATSAGGARMHDHDEGKSPPAMAVPPPAAAVRPQHNTPSLDALIGIVQPPPAQLRAVLAALQRSGITASDLLALSAQLSRADAVSDAAALCILVGAMLDDCGVRAPAQRLALYVLLAALSGKQAQQ